MATQIQETMTGDSSGTQEVVAKVRDTVQEKAGDLRSHASERLRGEVDQRSARVGEQLSSIVEAMRKGADHLQGQGNGPGAKTAHNVADQAQRLAGYLSVTSADKLLADLEQGARKRPWLAGGLGLTAGVIASRFLKASSERRYRASRGTSAQSQRRELPATVSQAG